MEKKELLYEGKAKKIFKTSNPELLWIEFKDDTTAFDGEKKEKLQNKGVLNNLISIVFFEFLKSQGIENHFVKKISEREMLTKKLEIIPVEVIVRNQVAGSMAKRLGLLEGQSLRPTVIEFSLKSDELRDPLINEYHVYAMDLASPKEIESMTNQALKINDTLYWFLKEKGINLVDFKLEFGRYENKVLLGDEITPDTCRLWEIDTNKKLDKDRFREEMGGVLEAYQEIYQRLKDA